MGEIGALQKLLIVQKAMYKTRNAGTGNGMRGTRGIGGR